MKTPLVECYALHTKFLTGSFGPGYRVYFTRRGEVFYLLLFGGDKSTQKRDIKRAIEMARALDKE